ALRHREGQPPDVLAEALQAAALAAISADRVDAAVAAADEAVTIRRRLGDPLRLGSALVARNAAVWNAGRSQEAYADGLAAVELLEQLPPSTELAGAYAFVATDKMLARDYDGAAEWGAKAVVLAEQLGAAAPLARALNSMGAARILDGDLDGAKDIRRSIAVAESEGLQAHVANSWINLGSAAGEVRAYALAVEGLERGIDVARERDLDGSVHYGSVWLSRVQFEQGAWDEARTTVAAVPLDQPRTMAITTITGLVTLGRIAARRGELDHGAAALDRAWELAQQTGDLQRLWPAAAGRAEVAWLRGDLAAVTAAVQQTFELAAARGHRWASGELAMWLHRAGSAVGADVRTAEPYRLQLAGEWDAAAQAWRVLGCPYEEAEAHEGRGDATGLRAALTIFDQLGARPAADRVRRRLRQLGERSIPRGPRAATVTHPAGLTRRQAEVLELLARGMKDAEIAVQLCISVKTAGHHVSAVLARLGASSRTEAARRAFELGLVTSGER
ncbi:MAG TPA: LuxR C-terminal-related transcriptional regulator, partial [Egibacteraceae bacterium]|nr:LuxR C-terminal-related transcriptional regulator [Egibacteraceae bacterium]